MIVPSARRIAVYVNERIPMSSKPEELFQGSVTVGQTKSGSGAGLVKSGVKK